MNFTILGPSDGQLKDDKSSMTDAKFGGHREVSDVAHAKDYTKRTGNAPNLKKNPVDETDKDVDDMSDVNDNFVDPATQRAKKREFSRRDETSDVQQSNEGIAVQSDPDNRPRMDEGSDITQVPETSDVKTRRSKLKGHFGEGQYDNMPNRGSYEGENS